jgi:D-alanyl-D-alanine carboxypeptidase
VHEAFTITRSELRELVASLPDGIRDSIDANPWYFLELLRQVIDSPTEYTVLVDKSHALPPDSAPADLVSLNEYDISVNRNDLSLSRRIMPDLLAMVEAARIDGSELVVSSAFRSFEYQATVYGRNVKQYGQEQADRESAQPGKSQHQLGTTIDFGSITDAFGDTAPGRWLLANAWRFGFSLSYPEGYEELTGYRPEVWHYRYISRPAAILERRYFQSVQQYMLIFLDENRSLLEASRVVDSP